MTRRLAVPVLALLVGAAGCTNDFTPQSDLTGPRVLALVASPLELLPGEDVTLRPEDYLAGVSDPGRRFTFCPVTAGAVSGYACAVHGPRCEVDLPVVGGVVTANPTALIADCIASLGVAAPTLPDQILTVFRYELAAGAGAPREAVLQVPQWTVAPPAGWERNLPPVILGVEIGGRPATSPPSLPVNGSLPVRLLIDPASVQTYVDAAGVTRSETMTGYFYTTAGTFSDGVTTGTDTTVELQATGIPPGATSLEVYVVALDLRGGQAVAGPFTVPIGP